MIGLVRAKQQGGSSQGINQRCAPLTCLGIPQQHLYSCINRKKKNAAITVRNLHTNFSMHYKALRILLPSVANRHSVDYGASRASNAMTRLLSQLKSLLVYTVLTASTIGPGTVAMCSKAGSDFGDALLWCVVVASGTAMVMQEASARLTIHADLTLGQALRRITPRGTRLAVLRHAILAFVIIGSFAYECNNFAGVMASVEMVVTDSGTRYLINALLGPGCFLMLAYGHVDRISMLLSVVVLQMIVCFAAIIGGTGVSSSFAHGLVPTIPEGGGEMALGVMGTTAVPLNVLLASSVVRDAGGGLGAMRRGIALASLLSAIISVLIQIVGDRASPRAEAEATAGLASGANATGTSSSHAFAMRDLLPVITATVGDGGVWGFALGLFGAGVSSALTVALGTALAIEDILGLHAAPRTALAALDEQTGKAGGGDGGGGGGGGLSRLLRVLAGGRRRRRLRAWVTSRTWDNGGRYAFYLPFFCLAAVPSLLRLPTMIVIMVAQLINGCLLPCIAALLYITVNHTGVMPRALLQPMHLNAVMAPTVTLAIFLAAVVLSNQLCGRIVALEWWTTGHAMRVAAPVAAVGVVGLSCAVYCLRRRPTQTEPTPQGAQVGGLQPPSSCAADRLARCPGPVTAMPTEVEFDVSIGAPPPQSQRQQQGVASPPTTRTPTFQLAQAAAEMHQAVQADGSGRRV